jgi:hypothetical protein
MGIVEAIKKGFGIASKNLFLVLILFIFNLIWNMVNIAIMPQGAMPVSGAAPAAATPPAVPPETAILALITSAIFIVISIFMQGGALGLVKDYIKEGKMKLGVFASYGLKYYLRLLGLGILIILIVLIIALIAALIIAATAPLNNAIATVIATIIAVCIGLAGIYFVLLLVMSPYALICDNANIIESMKHSMKVVRKAFWRVLLLLVLLVLIAIGIGVLIGILTGLATVAIPAKAGKVVIGVVNSLFNGYLGVVMMAAFMAYYLALTGKEKAAV